MLTADWSAIRLPSGPGSARGLPPCRAVGRADGLVVDATAGLGGDAFLLAVGGFRVLAIERHEAVFLALRHALARAEADPRLSRWLGGRLHVSHGDARALLKTVDEPISAVHLDPMYPARRKAALPSESMRTLRALVGDDTDAAELLDVAREIAPRVAVKRPPHGEPLGRPPQAVVRGKLARYDIYLRGSR